GFLPAHHSVRDLMHQAALANDIDPDRLGFTHSVEVIKRKPPAFKAGFSPSEDAHAPTADNP
ncbi:MAG: IS4 family transposase, partial [Opitutaceae bacterium]|nr:IS4 family transposase [Opitutaceae bacterium]